MNIKKGDKVIVLSGDDKGKQGTVQKVYPKLNKVVVEGVNVHKKAVRRTERTQGGLIDREFPIALCKLMPYDSEAKKGSRVATAEKDGKKARKLKASGKII